MTEESEILLKVSRWFYSVFIINSYLDKGAFKFCQKSHVIMWDKTLNMKLWNWHQIDCFKLLPHLYQVDIYLAVSVISTNRYLPLNEESGGEGTRVWYRKCSGFVFVVWLTVDQPSEKSVWRATSKMQSHNLSHSIIMIVLLIYLHLYADIHLQRLAKSSSDDSRLVLRA